MKLLAPLIALILILAPQMVCAAAADSVDPVVTIKPPRGYKPKRIALFPLEIPSYIVRGVTYPIGIGFRFLEEKGVVDKTLDFLSNKEKTRWVYPIIEGGAGTGFGGGVGFRDTNLFHKQYLLGASYRIHINMQQNANFSFAKPMAFTLFGRPVSYSLGSTFARGLMYFYYGTGNSSSVNNQGIYSSNSVDTGLTLTYEPLEHFTISPYLGVSISNSGTKGNEGSSPSVQSLFPMSELTAFGQWVDYSNVGFRLAHDTRDAIESTEKGGLRSFSFQNYYGMNTDGYNYNRYELDLRQYLRLWVPRQVLVLRANFVGNIPIGSSEVPFWRQAVLDASSPLRGFVTGRFRDRASILFNVEYRYPVWRIIDGVLFYDTGRVLHQPSDMTLSNIKYSLGGGLHIKIPNLAFFKFYAGYGGEGINIIFGAGKPL